MESRRLALIAMLLLSVFIVVSNLAPHETHLFYRVVNVYPHDPGAYTQGLVFHNGSLIESTGLYGRSSLRLVELSTGNVTRIVDLPQIYFGEGVTVHDGRVIQLTWRSQVAFIYNLEFELVGNFSLGTEGWGLTTDGSYLIISDGSPTLHILDPYTFQETHTVTVRDHSSPVYNINELEYVDGKIYANIWQTDRMIVIDLETGAVEAYVDLSELRSYIYGVDVDVLNGIAYHEGCFLLTGKLWPLLFEVEID